MLLILFQKREDHNIYCLYCAKHSGAPAQKPQTCSLIRAYVNSFVLVPTVTLLQHAIAGHELQ